MRIESWRLGAAYAKKKEKYQYGTIKQPGSVIRVLYDDDAKAGRTTTVASSWRHLQQVPGAMLKDVKLLRVMSTMLSLVTAVQKNLEMRDLYESNKSNKKYPKSFWECIILDDWREWVKAIRKEIKGWIENGAYHTKPQ